MLCVLCGVLACNDECCLVAGGLMGQLPPCCLCKCGDGWRTCAVGSVVVRVAWRVDQVCSTLQSVLGSARHAGLRLCPALVLVHGDGDALRVPHTGVCLHQLFAPSYLPHPPLLPLPQAERLRAKAQRPDTSRSMQQACRYLYYLGRIRAVQQEYSEAKDCLQQAARKVGWVGSVVQGWGGTVRARIRSSALRGLEDFRGLK